jgi:hypothetical protein
MRSLAHQICAFRDFLCGQISSGSRPRLAITMILLTDMAKMEIADSACYRHALTRAWRPVTYWVAMTAFWGVNVINLRLLLAGVA